MEWKVVKCQDVIDIRDGTHDTPKYVSVGYPLITSKNLKNGLIDFSEVSYISAEDHIEINKRSKVDKGDILLAMIGTIGNPVIVDVDQEFSIKNVALFKFKNSPVDPRFFKYLLESSIVKKQLERETKGGTQKFVSLKVLRNLEIPLAPIASQRRIADILDKTDEIVRKRKEAIALTEQLQKSIFLDMFGDPVINPKGWEVNKVIDYCDCIVPGRDKPKSFTGSIPWITTADLKFLDKTYFSNLNMKLSENEIKEVNAKIIPKNSVLLTCVGDLGVTSIAGCDMVVNQQLHSFQCKNINNYFLMYALPYQKIFMYKRATQTTVPYMNKNTCNSIPIIYPPRKLQEKFGILIAEINNKKGLYLKALQESENLFNSLLQKAFKGEL
jgi:type I restriction enzyme S subunit